MMVYTFKLSTPEAELGRSWIQGQPGLYSKTRQEERRRRRKRERGEGDGGEED
jgi:hypothetical protein